MNQENVASTMQLCLKMRSLGRFDLNHRLLEKAYACAPDDPLVQRSWGLALCREGRLEQGLEIYDRGRRQMVQLAAMIRPFSQPLWRGEDLGGKKLLLWAEQGVGDQLMQGRCIADLMDRGADVTFECDPRLHALLERSRPGTRFFAQLVDPLPELLRGNYDYQSSALSAWRWLYPRMESSRANAPWLKASDAQVTAYQNAWRQRGWRYNIGLSWYSKAKQTGARKSIAPEDLAPVLDDWRFQFHSLQYGIGAQQLDALRPRFGRPLVLDRDCDSYSDIDRLTAQIAALNLVISIDNITVHIAGSVGTPCWVILPCNCDWRWGSAGSETMLYRNMRLFRQSQPGTWLDVVVELKLALSELQISGE